MWNFLSMYAHRAVAMHASNVCRRCVHGFRNRNLFPPPLVIAVDAIRTPLFASIHQIIWHPLFPKKLLFAFLTRAHEFKGIEYSVRSAVLIFTRIHAEVIDGAI